jgi:hypothetical protein
MNFSLCTFLPIYNIRSLEIHKVEIQHSKPYPFLVFWPPIILATGWPNASSKLTVTSMSSIEKLSNEFSMRIKASKPQSLKALTLKG